MENVIIVRYGEIGVKSKNVRRLFERILKNNIYICLKQNKIKFEKTEIKNSRIYIFSQAPKKVTDLIKKTAGIVSFSIAKTTKTDIDKIKQEALLVYRKNANTRKKSFRITTKRLTKEFEYNSQQISGIVGEFVQENTGAEVNLSEPEININIEVNGENTLLFCNTIRGRGGMPTGTQGRVVCAISDKNSVIAALEAIKRGCLIHVLSDKIHKKYIQILNKYYYSRDKLCVTIIKNNKNIIKDAEETAKNTGSYAIVFGINSEKEIEKMPKSDLLFIFPNLRYNNSELKQLSKLFCL